MVKILHDLQVVFKHIVSPSLIIKDCIVPEPTKIAASETNKSATPSSEKQVYQISDVNSILIYNIACLSYQTQNYGQCLLYLKLIIENLDQIEEFLQVKSLFLALQVLFELKMSFSTKPLIDVLEVKLKELDKQIEQKSLIKN